MVKIVKRREDFVVLKSLLEMQSRALADEVRIEQVVRRKVESMV